MYRNGPLLQFFFISYWASWPEKLRMKTQSINTGNLFYVVLVENIYNFTSPRQHFPHDVCNKSATKWLLCALPMKLHTWVPRSTCWRSDWGGWPPAGGSWLGPGRGWWLVPGRGWCWCHHPHLPHTGSWPAEQQRLHRPPRSGRCYLKV